MDDNREKIHNAMLDNISNEYDKTTGSFFYDATKSVAIELEKVYRYFNDIPDKFFVENAMGKDLDMRVAEQGLSRKPATKATTMIIITGSEGATISEGDLVASDTVNFVVQETKIIDSTGMVDVLAECEVSGSAGNLPVGAMKYFPVTIPGLNAVTNNQAITNGYDGESDDELRQRYFDKVRTPATSGNKYHYRNWAKEVSGVGETKVFPLWNGPGTVKVVIIDDNKTGADIDLVTNVYDHIEELKPIGATITVESAIEVPIDIAVTLDIDTNNYTEIQVIENIKNNIIQYLKNIAFNKTIDYVSYAIIGSQILNSDGVIDYSNLTVNDETANIYIKDKEVAVLGGVTNV